MLVLSARHPPGAYLGLSGHELGLGDAGYGFALGGGGGGGRPTRSGEKRRALLSVVNGRWLGNNPTTNGREVKFLKGEKRKLQRVSMKKWKMRYYCP